MTICGISHQNVGPDLIETIQRVTTCSDLYCFKITNKARQDHFWDTRFTHQCVQSCYLNVAPSTLDVRARIAFHSSGAATSNNTSPPDLLFWMFWNFWKVSKRYFDVFGLFSRLIALPVSAVGCT